MQILDNLLSLLDKRPVIKYETNEVKKRIKTWLRRMGAFESDFCKMFNSLGYDKEDTIQINELTDDLSFTCYSSNNPDLMKMQLSCNSIGDSFIVIDKESDNRCCKYIVNTIGLDGLGIILRECELDNKLGAVKCHETFNYSMRRIELSDATSKITINLRKPMSEGEDTYEPNSDSFKINNEAALNEYLLSIVMPISFPELCHKIEDIIGDQLAEYDCIEIEVVHKTKDGQEQITDSILFEDSEVRKFTMTKDGYKIGIEKDNVKLIGEDVSNAYPKSKKTAYTLISLSGYDIVNKLNSLESGVNAVINESEHLALTLFRK